VKNWGRGLRGLKGLEMDLHQAKDIPVAGSHPLPTPRHWACTGERHVENRVAGPEPRRLHPVTFSGG